MEAKDTELTQGEFEKAEKRGEWTDDYHPILEAQCEKTWTMASIARIKEVVEWIEQNHGELGTVEQPVIGINSIKWHAKLKDWGIGEENEL